MNKLKAMKLATEITIAFHKSEYYKGQDTYEEDMLNFIENSKYKKIIENLKKGE